MQHFLKESGEEVKKNVNNPSVALFSGSESLFAFDIETSGRIISQFPINIISFEV